MHIAAVGDWSVLRAEWIGGADSHRLQRVLDLAAQRNRLAKLHEKSGTVSARAEAEAFEQLADLKFSELSQTIGLARAGHRGQPAAPWRAHPVEPFGRGPVCPGSSSERRLPLRSPPAQHHRLERAGACSPYHGRAQDRISRDAVFRPVR